MAPDINSLSPSSRSAAREQTNAPLPSSTSSRRSSQIMGPPTVPASAVVSLPPHRSPVSANFDPVAGMPLRHPRPLTAAELYLECEKEQEAVVNRLTRELTALRAQCASVASNASHSSVSTSASLLPIDISDPNPTHQLTGATHPTPSRRHRSSSSLSARSNSHAQLGAGLGPNGHATNNNTLTAPVGTVSQASADRAAAVVGTTRQPSAPPSGASTPARRSMDILRPPPFPGTLYTLPHRPTISRDHSYTSQAATSTIAQAGTPGLPPPTSPLPSPGQNLSQLTADPVMHRTEMDMLRADNEALRQRVRALEQALRSSRRNSNQFEAARAPDLSYRRSREHMAAATDHPRHAISSPSGLAAWAAGDGGVGGVAGRRERSESQSTTASSRRAVGVVEDELRVGESAGSAGIPRAS